MKNFNQKHMLFILFMVVFIGCVSLLFSCSGETDSEKDKLQRKTTTIIKTRGFSMLPEGKVIASVSGNKVKFAWNSIFSDCGWGPNVKLHSSHLGPIAGTSYRYYEKEMDAEMEVESYYIGKEWGALTLIITTCNTSIEIPLIYTGTSYLGEKIVCTHNFQPRETFIIIRASDYGTEIETDLSRTGKMVFRIETQYPTGLEQNAEWREFVKIINSGKQITNFSWYWNHMDSLYMGTLRFTVRIYDSHCENLPTDNCSNFLEKRISWSMANSYGVYNFSGNTDIIGG